MPLKPTTDWAAQLKQRQALQAYQQQQAAKGLTTLRGPSGGVPKTTVGSRGGVPLGNGYTSYNASAANNMKAQSGGGSTYTPPSMGGGGSSAGGGSTYAPPASGGSGAYTPPASGGGSTPAPGGAAGGSTPPAKPNENAPAPGGNKDTSYSYDWKGAFGGKPLTAQTSWLDKISDVMMPAVFADPQQITAQWAMSQGYGRGMESALNRYADPSALAMLDPNGYITNRDLGGFVGGFNQAITKNTGGSSINPRGVIQRVLSSSGDMPTNGKLDMLGQTLYGSGSAGPASQVENTLSYLNAALTGMIPQATQKAYLEMMERMGRDFLAWKSTPEGVTTAKNFGAYVMDRTGGTGGF